MRRVTKLAALAATTALALAACGGTNESQTTATPGGASSSAATQVKVGLAYDIGGRGDKSFNDSAATGLDRAKNEFKVEVKELSATQGETDADKEQRLRLLAQTGYNPVIAVGFLYQKSLEKVAPEFPNTKFGIIDSVVDKAPNVTGLTFAEEEGSYLVGVAAALKSKTGSVAFIGGCDIPLLQKFQLGFEAGAKAAKSDIKIQSKYLSTIPTCSGFNDPAAGTETANGMYDSGVDVIFAAAGGSGTGVFQAAKAKGTLAIGVDSDQYQSAAPELQPVILTSMLKRVDTAVYEFVKSMVNGKPLTGVQTFDLEKNGVGYSESGGFVTDIKADLDKFKADIVSGKVTVPTPAAS